MVQRNLAYSKLCGFVLASWVEFLDIVLGVLDCDLVGVTIKFEHHTDHVFLSSLNIPGLKSETFYLIFKPLKRFGIDAKRFAVRLYLTMEYVKTFQSKRKLRFTLNDLSSLLLYSSNKNHMNLSHIQIKEERVNGSSLLLIISMILTTLFLIFYL